MESIKNSRKKFKCETCYYYTSNKYDYNAHLNTAKHKKYVKSDTLEILSSQNLATSYSCNKCNYSTIKKSKFLVKEVVLDKQSKVLK
jgi:hypothetical protein